MAALDGLWRASRGGLGLLGLLAGCAATPPPQTAAAPPSAPAAAQRTLDDAIVGSTARQLEAAFGAPSSTLNEGPARRLQFAGPMCVLDAYLYPRASGEPAVIHVDTRRPTGEDLDRALCVAALRKR